MEKVNSRLKLQSRLTSDLFLLFAAAIWGAGFTAQRDGALYMGYFGFNAVRFLLGGLILMPFVWHRFRWQRKNLLWTLLAGLILFAGSALQQAGLETTSAGSAGFITGIYVVIVPILMTVFWRQPASPATWVAAVVALGGTYLLSTGGNKLDPSKGDLLVLAGVLFWALHVIVISFAVRDMDAFAFSAGQFLVCGLLHLGMSFFNEPITLAAVRFSLWPLLYAGLFSVGLGFTLQAAGQRHAPPADAALILSLEAVFGAFFGAVLLGERMNFLQVLGCALILAAILFAQLAALRAGRQTVPE
jgi:drug/metabolite transporter (DMT)-like permease